MRKSMTLLLAVAAVWGCGGDDATGPAGTATTRVSLGLVAGSTTVTTTALGQTTARASLAGDGAVLFGNIAEGAVSAINVQLDRVEVRPASGGGWVELDLPGDPMVDPPVILNLLDLPGESDDPVLLVRGDLEAGDYVDARIFFSNPELVLDEDVCLGNGGGGASSAPEAPPCIEAGSYTNVLVPSSGNTGIKTDAHFTIEEGSAETEVTLVFDPDATVKNITYAPGLESFIVAPVIRGPGTAENSGGG